MKRGYLLLLLLLLLILIPLNYAGILQVTDEHPFLINNSWIPAKQLVIGDLITTWDGKVAKITEIKSINKNIPVYNLEDSYYHNYVVGEDNLVVHNSNLKIAPLCFTGETLISMADGSKKQIKDIKEGDKVISWSFELNKSVDNVVKGITSHFEEEIFRINAIYSTKEHPFWTDKGWAAIDDSPMPGMEIVKLETGMKLFNGSEWIEVNEIELSDKQELVYNLEVENNHNYFASEVLVHNEGHPCSEVMYNIRDLAEQQKISDALSSSSSTPSSKLTSAQVTKIRALVGSAYKVRQQFPEICLTMLQEYKNDYTITQDQLYDKYLLDILGETSLVTKRRIVSAIFRGNKNEFFLKKFEELISPEELGPISKGHVHESLIRPRDGSTGYFLSEEGRRKIGEASSKRMIEKWASGYKFADPEKMRLNLQLSRKSKGCVPWEWGEIAMAQILSESDAYQYSTGRYSGQRNMLAVTETLNSIWHDGQPVRTPNTVRLVLRNYGEKSLEMINFPRSEY